jgi:hypothetical protein
MALDINQIKAELGKTTITRRIDRKEFINDLKAIPTPYVEVQFTEGTNQIIIQQPQGYKYICHIAKG